VPVSRNISILLSNLPEAEAIIDLATRMEQLGFARVWLAETNGADVTVAAGALAALTSMEIGTAIVPVYTRTPALLAMAAATVSRVGGRRRVHLGLGAGGQVMIERWHGTDFDRPLATTRDTLAILRQALAGKKTEFAGPALRSRGFMLSTGPAPEVSLYVGGMGPKMHALAAEQADGLIVTWLSPRILRGFAAGFADQVAAAGRRRDQVSLVARAYVAVTDRVAEVREAVRREMVEYIVSPGYGRYFASVGFATEVAEVNAAFARGDRVGTARAVSDRLLDDVLVVGASAGEVAETLRAYLEAGADDLVVQPVPVHRHGDPLRTIEAVAEIFSI
jgi:probable F420-dependent oxidoreductase